MSSFQKRIAQVQEEAGIRAHGSKEAYEAAVRRQHRGIELMKNIGRLVTVGIYATILLVLAAFLYWLWNEMVAVAFHLPPITYAAACGVLGILMVLRILFKLT